VLQLPGPEVCDRGEHRGSPRLRGLKAGDCGDHWGSSRVRACRISASRMVAGARPSTGRVLAHGWTAPRRGWILRAGRRKSASGVNHTHNPAFDGGSNPTVKLGAYSAPNCAFDGGSNPPVAGWVRITPTTAIPAFPGAREARFGGYRPRLGGDRPRIGGYLPKIRGDRPRLRRYLPRLGGHRREAVGRRCQRRPLYPFNGLFTPHPIRWGAGPAP